MSETEAYFTAFVNPLRLKIASGNDDIASGLLDFLLIGEQPEKYLTLFHNRKSRLAPVAEKLKFVPTDQRISDKLIAPLRHAYVAFLVGNFLGTLSLCGIIGEMLAIFKFDLSEFQINGRLMTTKDQESLFGKPFENLGQERRISILEGYGVINSTAAADLNKIRKIRNNYLHYWSNDHNSIENDAFQVFCTTINSVLYFIPQTADAGRITLDPSFLKYLEKENC